MAAKASMWLLGKGGLVCESRSERAIGDKNRSKIPYMLIYTHIKVCNIVGSTVTLRVF